MDKPHRIERAMPRLTIAALLLTGFVGTAAAETTETTNASTAAGAPAPVVADAHATAPAWHVGIALGRANAHTSGADIDNPLRDLGFTTQSTLDSSATGWKLYFAYRRPDATFGMEFGYANLGTLKSTTSATGVTNTDVFFADLRRVHPFLARGLTAAVTGQHALGRRVALDAKVGAFVWRSNLDFSGGPTGSDETGADPFYGVGARLAVSKHVHLGLEWERYRIEDRWVDFPSLAVEIPL